MKLAQKTQTLFFLSFVSIIVIIYCQPAAAVCQEPRQEVLVRRGGFAPRDGNCPGPALQLVHKLVAAGQSQEG